MQPLYYDRQGQPISLMTWARLLENWDYKRVRRTKLGHPRTKVLSAVWLGLDHNFRDEGPPLLFETMLFGRDFRELGMWRWSTEEDARIGHMLIADLYQYNYRQRRQHWKRNA